MILYQSLKSKTQHCNRLHIFQQLHSEAAGTRCRYCTFHSVLSFTCGWLDKYCRICLCFVLFVLFMLSWFWIKEVLCVLGWMWTVLCNKSHLKQSRTGLWGCFLGWMWRKKELKGKKKLHLQVIEIGILVLHASLRSISYL
jgi:hypothetical protein